MSMYKRYSGEFLDIKGVTWRADIYQEATEAFSEVGNLDFPSESPMTIEWGETSKEDSICGSTCTLNIESPGDRTYIDLYTITPGSIRLDIYRASVLYWSGCLDPEFYEEPYSTFKGYDTSLVFSDFGILQRKKYDLVGNQSLQNIINRCITMMAITTIGTDRTMISTTDGTSAHILDALAISSENFIDEDGNITTYYDVLAGILQPLGIRIQQRSGMIWLYDLNGLYNLAASAEVTWSDSNQILGVDKVCNNAKVTFSPYAKSELAKNEIIYEGEYSEEKINLGSDVPSDGEYYTYYVDYNEDNKVNGSWDYLYRSFTIFLSTSGSGLAELMNGARYFKICPLLGASAAEGVAVGFYTGGHGSLASGFPHRKLFAPSESTNTILMRTKKTWIPSVETSLMKNFLLRVSMEMLIDPRYNPYTEPGKPNEEGNYNTWKVTAGYVFVAAAIQLYDENGNVLQHYVNSSIAQSSDKIGMLSGTQGEWMAGAASYGDCWLEWYDPSDRAESSGLLGWKANRHCIGLSNKDVFKSFQKMDDGQYIPHPGTGGYIEITIYKGMRVYDYGETDWSTMAMAAKRQLFEHIRWMLYKSPKVELLKNNTVYTGVESDDVEYSGVININAKENIEIDTICGTMVTLTPSAKGSYVKAITGEQVSTLTRAGRTTQVEQLLIGTLYSQFASRHAKLTGNVEIIPEALKVYSEQCQPGIKFLCTSESQDVRICENEVTLIELSPDEYTSEDETD